MLGELICLDPDPGDSHTFQLLTGWDVFRVAPGSVLTVDKALDYERQRSYDVMVRCKDSGEPSETVTKTLTFTVKNVNEKPDGIALSHTEVGRNYPTLSHAEVGHHYPDNITLSHTEVGRHYPILSHTEVAKHYPNNDTPCLTLR